MLHKRFVFCTGAVLFLSSAAITSVAAQQVTIKETPPAAAADPQLVTAANPAAAKAHYKRACALQGKGEVDECILEFQQAIHLDMPDPAGTAHNPIQTADAYRQLGKIRQDKNQLISAVANYRASLKLQPNEAQTHVSLADALFDREFYDSSAAEYRAGLRLDPLGRQVDLTNLHINLGNCLDKLKQTVGAVTEYRKAVRLTPNDDTAHYNLSVELVLLGRYPEALRECREAIRLSPEDASYCDQLGDILYDSGEHEQGRVEWRKVLRMDDADEADTAREELAEYGP